MFLFRFISKDWTQILEATEECTLNMRMEQWKATALVLSYTRALLTRLIWSDAWILLIVKFGESCRNSNLRIACLTVHHMVNSMIAFTMSFALFFSALTALLRETLAWDMTNSMSLSSTPLASTSPSSSSSSGIAAGPVVPEAPISVG